MADNEQKPPIPNNTDSPLPNRGKPWSNTRYPKTSEARTALVEQTLRDVLQAVPLADYTSDKGKQLIETYRMNLNLMASGKIMYLRYLADPDAPLDDTAILEQIKRCRASHDTFQQWENDKIFNFFKNILRVGVMEMRMRVKALENVYFGVAERNAEGKPTLTSAQQELTMAVLTHFDWVKPTTPVTVNIGDLPKPGEANKAEREKLDQLTSLAAENKDQAEIVAAIYAAKHPKLSPLAVGADGEIKEGKSA